MSDTTALAVFHLMEDAFVILARADAAAVERLLAEAEADVARYAGRPSADAEAARKKADLLIRALKRAR